MEVAPYVHAFIAGRPDRDGERERERASESERERERERERARERERESIYMSMHACKVTHPYSERVL